MADDVAPGKARNDKQPRPEDWRELSDREAVVARDEHGNEIRLDSQHRLLCKAKRRDGKLCMSPAVTGTRVCRMHGGKTQKAQTAARMTLAELVQPGITTLAKILTSTESSDRDKLRAVENILDRTGFSRRVEISPDDADRMLVEKLMAMQEATTSADRAEITGSIVDAEVVEDDEESTE